MSSRVRAATKGVEGGVSSVRGPGRPAGASRAEVLAAARTLFRNGERIEPAALAVNLGIGRATIYRWFGSRDGLIGEVLAGELESAVAYLLQKAPGSGAIRLRHASVALCEALARDAGFRAFVESEQLAALRLVTASNGKVHPAAVRSFLQEIERAAAVDGYKSPIPSPVLAYSLVRLAEAFLYRQSDDVVELNTDLGNLDVVVSAILGLPTRL